MPSTRTGHFPIGFCDSLSHWSKDVTLAARFALKHQFEVIDIGPVDAEQVDQLRQMGLAIGSIDMAQPWSDLISADAGKRRAAVEANSHYIRQVAPMGVSNVFVVLLPEDPAARRAENLSYAADGLNRLCQEIEPGGARIVVEGWPGPAPYYPALACTPEGYRQLFAQVPSPALGVNYDPSHLVRMGIDPLRFLDEFASRIYHVHAKDTQLLDEGLYTFGNLQPATANKPIRYGGHHWRYCIPGHGEVPWDLLLERLVQVGYQGALSIELEDASFCGSPEDQERGLIAARDFLVHC